MRLPVLGERRRGGVKGTPQGDLIGLVGPTSLAAPRVTVEGAVTYEEAEVGSVTDGQSTLGDSVRQRYAELRIESGGGWCEERAG